MSVVSILIAEEPSVDLAILREMVSELETYLIKDDLFRTVIAHTPTGDHNVQMSGSDLLSRLHRLNVRRAELSTAQQTQLDTVQKQAQTTIQTYRTRFHDHLKRDMKSKLDTLKWFLDEREDMQRFRTNFPFEMRNRQRVEEVVKALGADVPADLAAKLKTIDERIHAAAFPSPFIWDEKLKAVYPQSPYWYLYVRP
jgi:hypothetical protein